MTVTIHRKRIDFIQDCGVANVGPVAEESLVPLSVVTRQLNGVKGVIVEVSAKIETLSSQTLRWMFIHIY